MGHDRAQDARSPASLVLAEETIRRYTEAGWWGTEALGSVVACHGRDRPDGAAFVVVGPSEDRTLTWRQYDRAAWRLAAALADRGLEPGDRVGVVLPDGAAVHVAFLAAERAGLVVSGIGARAGQAEVSHLLAHTGARAVLTPETIRGEPAAHMVAAVRARSGTGPAGATAQGLEHLVVPEWPAVTGPVARSEGTGPDGRAELLDAPSAEACAAALAGRALGPNDLWMLNSTSGTTGLPKCVMHTQNRWFYFHALAAQAGALGPSDVFFGAVPAPFGFGLWTAHFTPTILGAPTLVAARFDAGRTLEALARHRVTVLACVSTQFIMVLNREELRSTDLSALRVMFTGGEAVPFERAAEFERTIGAKVLQFYGSNETGALSRTTVADSRDRRLRTAGQVIDEMEVRVFDEDGVEQTGDERTGIPACRGPATAIGYYADDAANAALFTPDGWMLMGDVVTIDAAGYLRVVGRTSDIVIRGGKNISAPAVEAELAAHPQIALVAVVAMPDPVFGERVCAYVVPRQGGEGSGSLDLAGVCAFLEDRGVTREWFPEHLVVVDDLPRSSGAKIAKAELRRDIVRRMAQARQHGASSEV